ncbi:hypothetical protein ILYODFUR_037997 [Ilyodon furcidens]|uniref:Uncharacterized protein n=1 Tax=Ilyodon furcidens TaxID=33524 RepID=A0ABV0TQ81_9TELE
MPPQHNAFVISMPFAARVIILMPLQAHSSFSLPCTQAGSLFSFIPRQTLFTLMLSSGNARYHVSPPPTNQHRVHISSSANHRPRFRLKDLHSRTSSLFKLSFDPPHLHHLPS